jgi:hypothetical protein
MDVNDAEFDMRTTFKITTFVCIPEGVKIPQLTEILIKYLKEHP